MERIKVNSSNIHSVGYSEIDQILEIEFKQGNVYRYSQVSKNIYDSLMSASSHGGYFHKVIRDRYPTRKVR